MESSNGIYLADSYSKLKNISYLDLEKGFLASFFVQVR